LENRSGFVLKEDAIPLPDIVCEGAANLDRTALGGEFNWFLTDGKIVCFMAAFKAHAAFGFWKGAKKAALGETGGKAGVAMGQLGRITSLADLPPDTTFRGWVRKAVQATTASTAPSRPVSAARPRPRTSKTARRKA